MIKKPKGLGRGLDALLGNDGPNFDGTGQFLADPPPEGPLREVPISSLQPGRYQPRTRMDESALQDLAASIREHGVLQPIVVRPIDDDRYEIIAGERRYRAAALARRDTVPVLVRDVTDENALAIALIENIQREDLNPLEEAGAIKRLIDEFGYTHEQAAQAIGRSRSATTNLLRLLNLAEPVQTMLLAGDLEMGHARALLPLEKAEQILIGHQVVQKRLTVRDAEKLVTASMNAHAMQATAGAAAKAPGRPDRDVARLQERLADTLGTRVDIITRAGGRGRLVIHFDDTAAFSDLIGKLHLDGALDEGKH